MRSTLDNYLDNLNFGSRLCLCVCVCVWVGKGWRSLDRGKWGFVIGHIFNAKRETKIHREFLVILKFCKAASHFFYFCVRLVILGLVVISHMYVIHVHLFIVKYMTHEFTCILHIYTVMEICIRVSIAKCIYRNERARQLNPTRISFYCERTCTAAGHIFIPPL